MNLIILKILTLILSIASIVFLKKSMIDKKYSLKIKAKCIEIKESLNYSCPIFEIYNNDIKEILNNNSYIDDDNIMIGDIKTLYVNPNNHNDYKLSRFDSIYFFFGLITLFMASTLLLALMNIKQKFLMIYVCSWIIIFFGYIFFSNLKEFIEKKMKCKTKVEATIIGFKSKISHNETVSAVYKAIYEIQYNGDSIKLCNNVYSNRIPKKGEIVRIKIDKENPRIFIDNIWTFYTLLSMFISFSIVFLIIYNLLFNT